MDLVLIILIPFVLLFHVLAYFLVRDWLKLRQLRKQYAPILDLDKECQTRKDEIARLINDEKQFDKEFSDKKARLGVEYDSARLLYEKLKKEISSLEETLEMIECGIYKPHFEFDVPEGYRNLLELVRNEEKRMIQEGQAVRCAVEWSVGSSKAEGRKMTQRISKLMLRAFNGECDAALAKVRWDNVSKMEERIRKAFETINKAGEVTKNFITDEFLDLRIKELRLSFEYQEKLKEQKDEQRRIQEEMREEERAQRELEKAKEEAEREETRYLRALEKAKAEVLLAEGDKVNGLNEKIGALEEQLRQAQEQKERAISQAQLTKSGHVYIISNIGSLGENVYKIGMTRRLEPEDRIKELGDASVPFPFDIHAMLYSENAVEMERRFHSQFEEKRLNLVNQRKEFFAISLGEIEQWAKEESLDLKLTKVAEAREYRETQVLRQERSLVMRPPEAREDQFPVSVFSEDVKDQSQA